MKKTYQPHVYLLTVPFGFCKVSHVLEFLSVLRAILPIQYEDAHMITLTILVTTLAIELTIYNLGKARGLV